MDVGQFYDRLLRGASLESEDAGLRITARYAPAGGTGTKVFPPTYPRPGGGRGESIYLFEERYLDGHDGPVETVLLDATQSQANRCEEALLDAVDEGHLALPLLELVTEVDERTHRLTSLEAPHRSRDAYFRDAVLRDDPSTAFDDSEPGRALADADASAAGAYFRYAPVDLVYGSWDSHRGARRATRFPRVYCSETIGIAPRLGVRGGGRMDPFVLPRGDGVVVPKDEPAREWTLDTTVKGTKQRVSEIGHGMVPPTLNLRPLSGDESSYAADAGGGVSVQDIHRHAHVNFAGLARLDLGVRGEPADTEQNRAGRAALAALALAADRLAFARPAVSYRSGCDLVLVDEQIEWIGRGMETEPIELGADDAVELLTRASEAAERAGLAWETEPVRLAPADNLRELIERSFQTVELDGED